MYTFRMPIAALLHPLFTPSSHHFTALLHTINFFPIALLDVFLDKIAPISLQLSLLHHPFPCRSFVVPMLFQQLGKLHCVILSSLVGTFAVFFLTSRLSTPPSVHFPTAAIFDHSHLLRVCPYQVATRGSYVRRAHMYFCFLAIKNSIIYHYTVNNEAFSLSCS